MQSFKARAATRLLSREARVAGKHKLAPQVALGLGTPERVRPPTGEQCQSPALDFGTAAPAGYNDLLSALDATNNLSAGDEAKRKARFVKDVNHLRAHLRRTRGGLLNPRSKWVSYWDLTTCIALVYTATVTPFEVGVGLESAFNALFVINAVVNLTFAIDIVVQFFLPVRPTLAIALPSLRRALSAAALDHASSAFTASTAFIASAAGCG